MRKAIFGILVFIALIILAIRFGTEPVAKMLNIQDRAGIRVDASKEASVFIDNKEVGKTPFQGDEYKPGDVLVALKSDSGNWQGYVKLNSGTLSVVNRDLAQSQASGSGELITLNKGSGVTVTSTPDGADVEIDGKNYGKTPILVKEITPGEHLFIISHSNFLKRSIRAVLVDGYTLDLAVDLAISEADFTKITTTPIESTQQLVVRSTPTGFLRVRAAPNLNSAEVGRVKPGDTVIMLEELASWYKVRFGSDDKEGYVSSSFVEKKTP